MDMDTIPEIGQRVRYRGSVLMAACEGEVTKIYEGYKPDLSPAPFTPQTWHVAMRVDVKPEGWPYGLSDSFAPAIADIEPVE
jgi:hypothetical protein